MRITLQIGFIILVFGMGLMFSNHLLLSFLTILAIVFNFYFFVKDRRELANATYYVRSGRKTTFWELVVILAIPVIVSCGAYYAFELIENDTKETMEKAVGLYFSLIAFSTILANHYQRFKESVRSFPSGIAVPKNQNSIINWESISSIEVYENTLIIDFTGNKKFIFDFDRRDREDAFNIKTQFEKMAYENN